MSKLINIFDDKNDLRDTFWYRYNQKGRALGYGMDIPFEEGTMDLVTYEHWQGNDVINSFVFELTDIREAIRRAETTLDYVNRCWIVVPVQKRKTIESRFLATIQEKKYIGVMGVRKYKDRPFYVHFHIPEVFQETPPKIEFLSYLKQDIDEGE